MWADRKASGVARSGGVRFGVKFLDSLSQEFVRVCPGDQIFVREEQGGHTLQSTAIGFIAIVVDHIGKLGILQRGGDPERIQTAKLGEPMNIPR